MTLRDRVAELAVQGYWPAEIKGMVQGTSDRTVQQYYHLYMTSLEPGERARIEAIRAKRVKPSSGSRGFFEKPVLSPTHVGLGAKIYYFRKCLALSHNEFCVHYGFSNRVQLSTMEQGFHDFTLSEILRLAEIMEFSLPYLLGLTDADLSSERLLRDRARQSQAASEAAGSGSSG